MPVRNHCYEHSCVSFCMDLCCQLLWIQTLEQNDGVIGKLNKGISQNKWKIELQDKSVLVQSLCCSCVQGAFRKIMASVFGGVATMSLGLLTSRIRVPEYRFQLHFWFRLPANMQPGKHGEMAPVFSPSHAHGPAPGLHTGLLALFLPSLSCCMYLKCEPEGRSVVLCVFLKKFVKVHG